jgi:hypothetical protein
MKTEALLATARWFRPEYKWSGGHSHVADLWCGYAIKHMRRGRRQFRTVYASLNVEPWFPEGLVAAKLEQTALTLDELIERMQLVGWRPV